MTIQDGDKLYVIVRSDLTKGQQAVQAIHATVEFSIHHSHLYKEWHTNSNYVCLLEIENEVELQNLLEKAREQNIYLSIFREPDLNNCITAICLEPKGKKLVSNLKLAFK